MAVHLSVKGSPACGAGGRWESSQITSTTGVKKVDCKSCQRTSTYRDKQKD